MVNLLPWAIPLAPLAACILCTLFAILGLKRAGHLLVIVALATSLVATLALIVNRGESVPAVSLVNGYTWLDFGKASIGIDLRVDALSLFLLSVVTGVSLCVAIYSVGYMAHDAGFTRYFAIFAGFVFSMTMLVLADNLLVLYAFWEGVGLCSYLLIGFWYQRPSAAAAATKAFLVNRIADCGFLVGILLLWNAVNGIVPAGKDALSSLQFDVLFGAVGELATSQPGTLTLIGFLLLLGAMGKSAQFPLHVWLPDAMEGPTPVSALIHAATMVTAGVYLLARMAPLLIHVPTVLLTAAVVGAATALLGAAIALFQHDLKRVLAYSTVSQLGYMFLAIGCGASSECLTVAVIAAFFHLFTHAFFKALLFLSAGNVMHAMGNVIDMRRLGGLRSVLPWTHVTFLIGALALAGVPPLAGFWSKDGVLAVVSQASHGPSGGLFSILLVVGFATSLMTAVYTFRAYFITFWGPKRIPQEAGDHPHEATPIMLAPLCVLGIGSLIAGAALGPTGIADSFLRQTPNLPQGEAHHESLGIMAISTGLAAFGLVIAWFTTRRRDESTAPGGALAGLRTAGENRFYFDEIYQGLIVIPIELVAVAIAWVDRNVIDGLATVIGRIPLAIGWLSRRWQTGVVSSYGLVMAMGVVVLVALSLMS